MTTPEVTPSLTPAVEQLAEIVRTVRDARVQHAALRAIYRESQEAFERANAPLQNEMRAKAELVEAAERTAKTLAVELYRSTGETKPTAGVEVKLVATVRGYEEADALKWAHAAEVPGLIVPESLDRRAFESAAKKLKLPFVTITEEPRASIATDLDKALGSKATP